MKTHPISPCFSLHEDELRLQLRQKCRRCSFISMLVLVACCLLLPNLGRSQCNNCPPECAISPNGHGPDPCAAKIYCPNNASTVGLVTCDNSAGTDGWGIDANFPAATTASLINTYFDGVVPDECYREPVGNGQNVTYGDPWDYVQWIKFATPNTPDFVNQLAVQASGKTTSWVVFYAGTAPAPPPNTSVTFPNCTDLDLTYVAGACSGENQYKTWTNLNAALNSNVVNLYYIALFYKELSNGSVNFKNKECDFVCPPLGINCPAPQNLGACSSQAAVNAAFTTWLDDFSASGGCNPVGTGLAGATAPSFCGGSVTINYSVTDCCNQPASCSSTFTVASAPTLSVSCPGNASLGSCQTQATVNQAFEDWLDDFSASGGCGTSSTDLSGFSAPNFCGGSVTVTFSASDNCNQSASCSATFTVASAPTLSVSCPGNANLGSCQTQAAVNQAFEDWLDDFSAAGGCGTTSTDLSGLSAPSFCGGNVMVTFSASDNCNQSASCSATFTVASAPMLTVSCPGNASLGSCQTQAAVNQAFEDWLDDFSASGGCGTTSTDLSGLSAPSFCGGNVTVTFSASDNCNQSASCSATFTVASAPALSVSCPAKLTVECVADVPVCGAASLGSLTISGGCNPIVQCQRSTLPAPACTGQVTFTYTVSDACNQSATCTQIVDIDDKTPPQGTCPPNLDVTNVACINDLPCPTSSSSAALIAQLKESIKAAFTDCSGVVVSLENWSALQECSDPDNNGSFTFGRTFNFKVADGCGNVRASSCPVTFSGTCLPLCTFTQGAWGNAGGAPGATLTPPVSDLVVLHTLLSTPYGPLVLGGNGRSLTLTNAQCIVNMLPGNGTPGMLANCHQTNCSGCNAASKDGRLQNNLATQVIALLLNVRFNIHYKGLSQAAVLNQGLGCIAIPSALVQCNPVCSLKVVASNGTFCYPYTIGGLLQMAKEYLEGTACMPHSSSGALAGNIATAVAKVNEYWDECEVVVSCSPVNGNPLIIVEGEDEFYAMAEDQLVHMYWTVQNNPDVDHFRIERSTNGGETFDLLFEENAKDTKLSIPLYSGKDDLPQEGDSHYRVQVLKKDGESYYLPTRTVHVKKPKPFGVFPNPANDEVFINLEPLMGREATIVVYDFLSREIYRKHIDEVSEAHVRINLEGHQPGLYVMYVEYAIGVSKEGVGVKFVVERK